MVAKCKWLFGLSVIVFFVTAILLLTGSQLLSLELIKQPSLPLGSVITPLGMLSMTLVVFLLSLKLPFSNFGKTAFIFSLIFSASLALFWLPLGRFLSGNWHNTFVNRPEESLLFWNYTYVTVAAPIALILIVFVKSIWTRIKAK